MKSHVIRYSFQQWCFPDHTVAHFIVPAQTGEEARKMIERSYPPGAAKFEFIATIE